MKAERWRRLEDLFHQAVDLPIGERHGFLKRIGRDDPSLRLELETLLAADGEAGSYMERRRTPPERDVGPAEPTELGDYRLVKILGEGGMGVVYLAEQVRPVNRQVALKLIRSDLVRRETILRFEAERQALARVNHPNVAQVYEAGTGENGQPFFTFEYVPGPALTKYCDQRRLSIRQRLELFITVCEAVQHLHQKGLVHRDVKPSNVLVTEEQGRPVPKIIDLGIAKALEQPLVEETLVTGRQLLGTPSYMSPEAVGAARGELDVDTRSDVYSLGVLLYELLVGDVPFADRDVRRLLHRVVHEEATPPSSRLGSVAPPARDARALQRRTDPARLRRLVRGELDWITLKALAKDRSKRYVSAAELGADVVRFVRHEPVLAGPPSAFYRAKKLFRRHAAGTTAVTLAVLALAAGFVGRSLEAQRADREALRAQREAARAQEVADFLVDLFRLSDPKNDREARATVVDLLDVAAEKIATQFENEPLRKALLMDTLGVVYKNRGSHERSLQLLSAALEIRRNLLSEGHPDTVSSLHNLGTLHLRRGRYRDAETYLRRALAGLQAGSESDRSRQISTLTNLAILCDKQARYEEAVALYTRCLRIVENRSDQDPSYLSKVLMDLAITHAKQGTLDEAERLLLRALAIQRGIEAPSRRLIGNINHNLAGVYEIQGRLDEAAAAYEQSLEIDEALFGSGHLELASTLNNLSIVHQARGDLAAAESALLESLEIKRRHLRDGHPDLATGLHGLAMVYQFQGRLAEAETLFLESRDMALRAFEPTHPFMGHSSVGLAMLHLRQGRHAEAERHYERGLEIFEVHELTRHPDVVRITEEYAVLRSKLSSARNSPGLDKNLPSFSR